MSRAPDVLVVGGGAIGVCVALETARCGATVTLVERGPELASGCSAGNAGLICPSHAAPLATPAALREGVRWLGKRDSPFSLRPRPSAVPWLARFLSASTNARAHSASLVIRGLSSMSLTLHEQLAASGVETGLARRGVLNVYTGEVALAEARREADESRAHGLQAEVLDRAGALEEVPSLAGSFAGAVYHPGDAHCDPLQFVRAVGEAAKETGASLRTGVEVLGLRRQGGRVVSVATTTGDLLAGEVVLAAGAWTPSLTRELGLVLPVEGGKGYHIDLEAGTGDPTIPVWFQESRVIVTPLPGRVRLAGTLELAGLDLSVNRRRVAAVERAGRRGLHGLEARKTLEVWRGLRPCSPDGLPIIGRPDGLENVVLATGHGMMGLTLAPITGRLVAEISMGAPPSHGLGPVSPARFRSFLGL